jgi:hypothetical protein
MAPYVDFLFELWFGGEGHLSGGQEGVLFLLAALVLLGSVVHQEPARRHRVRQSLRGHGGIEDCNPL